MGQLPACGLYRTVSPIGGIPAGRLVYFHNHGDPGPGVYLPEGWTGNRARFSANGTTVANDFDARALQALPEEGFYRVVREFYCCEKQCTKFEPDTFVQLGYNGAGKALVFLPELGASEIAIPERGSAIDDAMVENLKLLNVAKRAEDKSNTNLSIPRGFIVH